MILFLQNVIIGFQRILKKTFRNLTNFDIDSLLYRIC